jgi:xanthosine utilization system XapX-like protein
MEIKTMANSIVRGIVAGAAGTVALNIATYVDMALRARPASSTPSQLVAKAAQKANVALSPKGVGADDETAQNRESGLGALLGYVNGLGVGILYALLRDQFDDVPVSLASVGVGAAAMAASDVPLVSFQLTDPRSWGVSGWLSDAIPHLVYGLVTTAVYEALSDADE